MAEGKMKRVISNGEIEYSVVHNEGGEIPYGIYVKAEGDSACVKEVFFTEEEAVMRCKWLCAYKVYPIALRDVLANIF